MIREPEFRDRYRRTVRILLVEDDPQFADLVQTQLRRMPGVESRLEVCATLAEASERLAGGTFDLIVTDLNLPDSAGPLDAAATNKALGLEVPPDRKAMAGYGSLADVLATLEAALAGRDYLVGDRFSAADVYVGSHIGWGMIFGTIEKRPAFERYFARLGSRPAAIRAREIDEALMPKDQPG